MHKSKTKFSGCEEGTWGGKGGEGRGKGSTSSHMHGLGGIGVGMDCKSGCGGGGGGEGEESPRIPAQKTSHRLCDRGCWLTPQRLCGIGFGGWGVDIGDGRGGGGDGVVGGGVGEGVVDVMISVFGC